MGNDALAIPSQTSGDDRGFVQQHLDEFSKSVATNLNPEDVGNTKTLSFVEALPNVMLEDLPDLHKEAITRSQIFGLAKNPNIDTVTVCAAIMAWGGMHRGNRPSVQG